MNLNEQIELEAGGPGSGCNPRVGKCGPNKDTFPPVSAKDLANSRFAIHPKRSRATYFKHLPIGTVFIANQWGPKGDKVANKPSLWVKRDNNTATGYDRYKLKGGHTRGWVSRTQFGMRDVVIPKVMKSYNPEQGFKKPKSGFLSDDSIKQQMRRDRKPY